MPDLTPGDRVLFREGDRFSVALVDLVKPGHVTAFPYDVTRRSWARARRRILASYLIERLPAEARADEIARRINVLTNQRDAKRQQANSWLEKQVRAVIAQPEDA